MRRGCALPLAVAVALAATPAISQQPAEPAPGEPPRAALANASPRSLAEQIGPRFGGELAREKIEIREAPAAERRTTAAQWIEEAFAPLAAPACRPVLEAARIPPGMPPGLAETWPEDRPAAARTGVLLVPDRLPPLGPAQAETLTRTGLLPIEIALTGEWVRAAGVGHAGPPAADPLLRLARAARLEGAARLAGIVAVVGGSGVDPERLGAGLLEMDRDAAGWPRGALLASATDDVRRALLRVLVEDGLRWALLHYVKAGLPGLLAAMESPAAGPADLLRPGLRLRVDGVPADGCHLGPRAAAVLLAGTDDPPWVDQLRLDSFSAGTGGRVGAVLGFESDAAASRAAGELRDSGWQASAQGHLLRVEGVPTTARSKAP
ncbi:MAG: hypothetical protein KBD01_12195 [Acidobacteria bacterium]|nr:hypothetical protein [Acidobacteriota bacterium]